MMKNNKIKQIAIVSVLLVVAIVLAYGIYQKSQPNAQQADVIENSEVTPEVNVEDIENKVTIDVPKIKDTESEESKEGKTVNEEVPLKVEKPVVPSKPEPPKEESPKEESTSESVKAETKPIPKEEDVVKSGDEEENPNPPTYEELPKVEEKSVENPVIVTPNVPEDTSNDRGGNLVPDSENPFLKPPSEVPSNGNRGEMKSDEYSDYIPNTGDKF